MDIYALSRSFWDYSFENPEKIKPNHIAMYFFAIEHCNRLGWKKKFGFPTSMVMDAISIKSYSVYKKTFDELAQFGFFEIIELSKNQYSSNIIALKENYNANAKALDKALTKHTSKQCQSISESTVQSTSESNDSIDIQVYNNTNIQNNIIIAENIEIENNNSETLETEKEKRKKVAPKKESEPMYDTQFLNLNSENIKISISEFEKLCTEYTQEISEQSIIYLSDYKTEKAYKTKSDYLTIKRWVASAVKEKILKNKKIQNDTKTIDGGRENTFGGFKQSEIDRFFNQ